MSAETARAKCRACDAPLTTTLVDLGDIPLVNEYPPLTATEPQARYPLHGRVCDACFLVQVEDVVAPESIFSDYPYFSSYSASWLEHAARFAEEARREFALDHDSFVVEIASNDGYLLRHFVGAGIPVLGVEPAANIARFANEAGVPTENRFFGQAVAEEIAGRGRLADLVVANNVIAHVPAMNDFVAGLATVLAPGGVLSVEFTHLLTILEQLHFDGFYHEHFSYISLLALEPIYRRHGLEVFDVARIPTHVGSLRVLAQRADGPKRPAGPGLDEVRAAEAEAGLDRLETYADFSARVEESLQRIRAFLDESRKEGKTVVGYGAAAKGTILLNALEATTDDVAFVVDISPHKQERFLPGTRIPIHAPNRVSDAKPDYLLILAHNLRDEIMSQMAYIRDWGGRFVTPLPEIQVLD